MAMEDLRGSNWEHGRDGWHLLIIDSLARSIHELMNHELYEPWAMTSMSLPAVSDLSGSSQALLCAVNKHHQSWIMICILYMDSDSDVNVHKKSDNQQCSSEQWEWGWQCWWHQCWWQLQSLITFMKYLDASAAKTLVRGWPTKVTWTKAHVWILEGTIVEEGHTRVVPWGQR